MSKFHSFTKYGHLNKQDTSINRTPLSQGNVNVSSIMFLTYTVESSTIENTKIMCTIIKALIGDQNCLYTHNDGLKYSQSDCNIHKPVHILPVT